MTSQLGLEIYNCVTENVYTCLNVDADVIASAKMPCRDFQMAFYQFIKDHLLCRTFKWLLLNLQRLDLLCLHKFFYDFQRV